MSEHVFWVLLGRACQLLLKLPVTAASYSPATAASRHSDLLISFYNSLAKWKIPHFTDEDIVTKQSLIFLSQLLSMSHFQH